MDLMKILEDLRRERASIEEAILTLERLVEGRGRRRGRPPTWLAEARKRGRRHRGTGDRYGRTGEEVFGQRLGIHQILLTLFAKLV